jgi:hypothetical protein
LTSSPQMSHFMIASFGTRSHQAEGAVLRRHPFRLTS